MALFPLSSTGTFTITRNNDGESDTPVPNQIPISIGFTMSKDETLRLRNQFIPKACSLHFDKAPLKLTRGLGQYLYDDLGIEYLDCVNCVAHVGHCHPGVVEAGKNALKKLGSGTNYGKTTEEYLRKLKTTLPNEHDTFFFLSSVSEANDMALQIAKSYTGGTDIVAVERSFHGSLMHTNEFSPRQFSGPQDKPTSPWVHIIPCPDLYRGKYINSDLLPVQKYANDAEIAIANIKKSGRKLAAFISEPILTIAGIIIPSSEWINSVYKSVKSHGGLIIADEAQTGLGRTGICWWGFQRTLDPESVKIHPDLITIGKPLGNGHPMALLITKSEIISKLNNPMVERLKRFSECDDVSASIGIAVLNAIRSENLMMNAKNVGLFLLEGLKGLANEHQYIGEVRGLGLMIGVEIVYSQESRKPCREIAERIVYMLKEENIIMGNDGIYKNILIILPPMTFNTKNAHRVILTLDKILKKIAEEEYNNPFSFSHTSNNNERRNNITDFMNSQPGTSSSTSEPMKLLSTDILFDDSQRIGLDEFMNFPSNSTTGSRSRYEEMD